MKEVTPDWLCLELAAVKAQIAVQAERSKGDAVSLGKFSFACELDWASWCIWARILQVMDGRPWLILIEFGRLVLWIR